MKFLHSFPRPRKDGEHDTREGKNKADSIGYSTLESILRFGLLCTPETLKIYPAPATDYPPKQVLLRRGEPEYRHRQSRLCLTLCEPHELFEIKIRGLRAAESGPVSAPVNGPARSHAQLFGAWAIGFDPLVARRLGFVPAIYYSPTDMQGERAAGGKTVPGLSIQMIQRLNELRGLLILLAHVESGIEVGGEPLADEEMLRELELDVPFEPDALARAMNLDRRQREAVFAIFDTDRESALGLLGFVEMMLSLFQETDSSVDQTPFAYFQQREWRLIHHMRKGMIWYCLGCQPRFRSRNSEARPHEIRALRALLSRMVARDEAFFRSCWLLEEVGGVPIRDYITQIVAPASEQARVRELMSGAGIAADLSIAEDLGYVAPA